MKTIIQLLSGAAALSLAFISNAQQTSNPGGAGCVALPAGLVSWWKAESNGVDIINGNTATLQSSVSFAAGEVGQAFQLNSFGAYLSAPASASLNVGTNDGMTVECWINPTNVAGFHPITEWRDPSGALGVHFWLGAQPSDSGLLFANVIDSAGNGHGLYSAQNVVVPNAFQHVALTYDKASGVGTLYLNGAVVAQASLGSFVPQTSYEFWMGVRPFDYVGSSTYGSYLSGLLDEVSLYKRALSQTEIQAIYNAGSAGKCLPVTPPSCDPPPAGLVSWWKGESNALDVIGGNNGTLAASTSYGAGEVGQAFVFHANGDGVRVGNPANLRLQNFTIEAWIQRSSTSVVTYGSAGDAVIFGYGQGGYGLGLFPNGNLWLSQIGVASVSINYGVTDTNLHHVAVTKTGSTVVFYIDGTAYNAGAYNPGFVFNTAAAIGARGDNLDNTFLGLVDEPSVYSRALSATEVQAIYNAGAAGKCMPLPPAILLQPTNQIVTVGGTAIFAVQATGTQPLNYQWSVNTTNILGATNATLNLSNVQLSQAGNYAVLVSNSAGSILSSNALLTVNPVQVCYPPPAGIAAWWKAESNGVDTIGGNTATLQSSVGFAAGEVGQAFQLNSFGAYLSAPASASLNVGTNGGMTVEAWINPTNVNGFHPIAEWNTGSGGLGSHLWLGGVPGDVGVLFANIFDTTGNSHILSSAQHAVAANVFQHVALTYDKASGVGTLYVNGAIVAQASLGTFTPQTSYNLWFGVRPGDAAGDSTYGSYLSGLLDEASLYKRALSQNEIQSIYNAGSAGKCVPVTVPPCDPPPAGLVSWWKGESNALDVIGGNNGTLAASTSYGAGEVGQAFVFHANGDGVRVGNPANLRLQNFTIEAWIQRSSTSVVTYGSAGDAVIFGYGQGGYGLGLFPNGNLWLSQIGVASVSINYGVTDTNLHHVAVTKTGSTVVFYIDGTAYNAGAYNPGFVFNTAAAIGARGDNLDNTFLGLVDEPSVYSRALSATEVQAIYNAGAAGKCMPLPPPQVPVITSFNPVLGAVGASITLTGTKFSPVPANNVVYFGAVRAAVTAASPTSLTVMVPTGATYAPITETVNGLTAWANAPFLPTYPGAGTITSGSLAPRVNLNTGNGPYRVAVADIDGDGKADLVEINYYDGTVSIYRNISTNGTLASSSFAAPVTLTITGAANSLIGLAVADLDGDGRLDIVTGDWNLNQISIFQNLCSPGSITSSSFGARVDIPVAGTPGAVAVGDLDGDGKPEIVTANFNGNTISVLKNIGNGGILTASSFAAPVSFATGTGPFGVAIGDLDGDGKKDIATANSTATAAAVSVFQNIALFGSITTDSLAPRVDLPGLNSSGFVSIGDLDGDGKLDLVVASASAGQAVSVYRNTSTMGSLNSNSFAPKVDFAVGAWAHTVAIGDLDGDGKPDLAVAAELPSKLCIFKNTSTPGSFTTSSFGPRIDFATGYNAWSVQIGDLDGDGRSDLVLANQYDNTLSIYRNLIPVVIPCTPPPPGIVAWWQGEGNGLDVIGGNTATLQSSVGFAAGEVGQAFQLNSFGAYLSASASASLNVGTNSGMTVECWINPTNVNGFHPIAEWRNIGSNVGVHLWLGRVPGDVGVLFANVMDSAGNSHSLYSAQNAVTANAFQHVALTYDKASGVGTLYLNGAIVAQASLGSFTPQTSYNLSFGVRPGDYVGSSTYGSYLSGLLDEVSLYSRALTQAELQAIYNAGAAGKCGPRLWCVPDLITTATNTATQFAAAKLALNDVDLDGYPLTVTGVSAASSQGGTVALASGQVTYTPHTGFMGNDTFTYSVSDGHGGTAMGVVTAMVGPIPVSLNIVFGPVIAGGNFVVSFAGIPGLTYTIEAAPALAGPWTKVANLTAPTTNQGQGIGGFSFSEPVNGNTARFYRTVYPAY